MALKSEAAREGEHMARRKNKDSEGQRKEAEEGRRWRREVIKRKCKRGKLKVGTGDVKGMHAEMAGWEKGERWKQKEKKRWR